MWAGSGGNVFVLCILRVCNGVWKGKWRNELAMDVKLLENGRETG